jgi:hypothetical protein
MYTNFLLLSSRPTTGILLNKTNGLQLKEMTRGDWLCDKYCVMPIDRNIPISDFSVGFQPSNTGANNLLSQLLY